MTMRRRDALKTIGGLAGAAGMARFLPGCGDGDDGPVGITTYVYLMLENRTYDNVFGGRSLEGLGGDGLRAGTTNPDTSGMPVASYVPEIARLCVADDPPHGWERSHAQWNNGAMNGFVTEHQLAHGNTGTDPMQYMTRDLMPISWALADNYTSCDRWFASVMGPTLPNRGYWHAATSYGLKANGDVLDKVSNGVPLPTIYNLLDAAQVDWAYYYGGFPVVPLLGSPGPYQLDLGPSDGTGHIRRFGDPEGRLGQFFKDAAAGKLPPVVYIDPSFFENDDHPPVHPIRAQSLIAAIYAALAKSPQWKNCMLLVVYDEHGGFFDHVPPPTTTDDTLEKFGIDGFQQMGFRVPAMVAGPYVKQNYVSSVTYDHTSALKQLQSAFGLEPLNPRMAAANDLTDCIDMERLAAGDWAEPVELPEINLDDWAWNDPRCMSSGEFRYQDPISQWADANPGSFNAALDLRGTDPEQRAIREFLRAHYRSR